MENKEILHEELKNIQIGILDRVSEFCIQNGINYSLSSGTLIGAVRHKGYIPWDDDIDIYMLRCDYERFVREFNDYNSNYRVLSLERLSEYPYPFAKVEDKRTMLIENFDNAIKIGVNIDIFPIDGVPDDNKIRKSYFSRIESIRRKIVLKNVSVNFRCRGIIKNFILILGKMWLKNKTATQLARQLDSMIDKTAGSTDFVCNLVMGNGIGSEFHRSVMSDYVDIEFEGKFYKAMAGYEEYLTQTYGNYMQLPPEEQRVTHHSFKAYWK